METEIGPIATMIQGVENESTPLQQRMDRLAKVLVIGSLALVFVVVGIGVLRGGWSLFSELLETSLKIVISKMPY